MKQDVADTYFAPAERLGPEAIREQHLEAVEVPNIQEIMDALPYIAGVINAQRQFVLVNRKLLDVLGMDDMGEVLGQRPGEAFCCIHAAEHGGGCGTAESCRYCGAIHAVIECLENDDKATRECRIKATSEEGEVAMDLRVTASPFAMNERGHVMLAIVDISEEKRRRAIETIFFHDVMNLATTMFVLLDELQSQGFPVELEKELDILKRLSGSMLEDIGSQRDLTAAEDGDLVLRVEETRPLTILEEVARTLGGHKAGLGRVIEVDPGSGEEAIRTDPRLLKRTVANMVKNALEATPRGGTVTAGVRSGDGGIEVWVHNPTSMPRSTELQVFQRSFSTKGPGRGLGTYSMKLLGEQYLQGKVVFETGEESGTTFRALFPRSLRPEK